MYGGRSDSNRLFLFQVVQTQPRASHLKERTIQPHSTSLLYPHRMEQMDVTTGLRDVELGGISRSSSPELSNLCKYCRALLDWRWVPFRYPRLYHGLSNSNDLLYWAKKYLDHHESWSELKACSDSGCTLCQLFMSSGWEPFPNIGTGFRLFLLYEPAN